MIGWPYTEASVPRDRLEDEARRATNSVRYRPGRDSLFEGSPDIDRDPEGD